jgi:hypothetical protein
MGVIVDGSSPLSSLLSLSFSSYPTGAAFGSTSRSASGLAWFDSGLAT